MWGIMFTQGAALGYVIVGLSARLRPHYQFYRTAIKVIIRRMKVIKMRKIIKRLFISAITFILLIFAIFISIIDIEEAIEPPKGAVRIGDLKDIYWLKKISVSHNSMRICIYNDYNGDFKIYGGYMK